MEPDASSHPAIATAREVALNLAAAAGANDLAAAASEGDDGALLLDNLLTHELAIGHALMARLAAGADGFIRRIGQAPEGQADRAVAEASRLTGIRSVPASTSTFRKRIDRIETIVKGASIAGLTFDEGAWTVAIPAASDASRYPPVSWTSASSTRCEKISAHPVATNTWSTLACAGLPTSTFRRSRPMRGNSVAVAPPIRTGLPKAAVAWCSTVARTASERSHSRSPRLAETASSSKRARPVRRTLITAALRSRTTARFSSLYSTVVRY